MAELLNVVQLGSREATQIVKNTLDIITKEDRSKAARKGVATRRANAEAKQKLQNLVARFAPQASGAAKADAKARREAQQVKNQKQNGWNSRKD